MIKLFLLVLFIINIFVFNLIAQIKIMPLGNSITAGQFKANVIPEDNNSYRKELLRLLRLNGYNTIFVGSNSCGDMDQKANEGHSGWKISELTNGRTSSDGIKIWIPKYKPDIILLEIGTNDFNTTSPNLANALTNVENLIKEIFIQKAEVKLVVASLIPIWYNNNYFSYNKSLVTLVKKYKDSGKNIWFYDMYDCGIGLDGYRDRLHPNATPGYVKMGAGWYSVCKNLLDTVTVCERLTNPVVNTFFDRTIIRWHATFDATKFIISSSDSHEGPYSVLSSNVNTNWYEDYTALGKMKFYIVQGISISGKVNYSDTLISNTSSNNILSIDCANAGSGSFIDDALFTGGNMFWFYYSTVTKDASMASIPDFTLKTARAGNFNYRFSNLDNQIAYKLVLYFMEGDKTSSASRVFDVVANGSKVLTSFDVYQAAGGKDKAIKREFNITPTNGEIFLEFKSVKDSAIVNAITLEIARITQTNELIQDAECEKLFNDYWNNHLDISKTSISIFDLNGKLICNNYHCNDLFENKKSSSSFYLVEIRSENKTCVEKIIK